MLTTLKFGSLPRVLRSLPPAKQYVVTTFLISCLLLAIFTFVIYQQSKLNEDSNRWIIYSYEVLRRTSDVLIDIYNGDAAERNYIATGLPGFLASYEASIKRIDQNLDMLAVLTADNPKQLASFKSLREDVEQLKQTGAPEIKAVGKHGHAISVPEIHAKLHRQIIENIRSKIQKFSRAEFDSLDTHIDAAHVQQHNYMRTLFIGAILDLGALVIANILIFGLVTRGSEVEEKMRKNEKLFATILNGINDGIYDYNVPQGTIYYSPSYQSILGYTKKELENLSSKHDRSYNYIHPDDVANVQETMRRYFAHEIPSYNVIFRMRHGNGHWVWLLSRAIGVWDEKGQIQRLIGTHVDITAQKQREEELKYFIAENERQKQELEISKEKAEAANQAKSDFLATMSHEIRTPLNAVIGLARLLMDKVQTPQKREMVETLCTNADILLKLVNDLLDLTRIESAQIKLESRSFTLGAVFKSLHAMFDDQVAVKGLTLSMTDNSKDQVLIGDPIRLQQILVNLASNALKFTVRGGITITADLAPRGGNMADVHIAVVDTGIGIPPEKLATIFDKFVQADQTISRRFGGSGLGLAISRSLAQLMGGDIAVASKPGEGSVFTVSLSLQTGRQRDVGAQPKSSGMKSAMQSGTVLVVEDYAANVMVATMMLENIGYSVEVAASGAEAIRKVENRRAPYTAILMDVQMQDMDGFETTRRIRALEKERGFSNFIIGVTAHALAGDRERCLEAGMDEYMSKPVHPDLLARKLGGLAKAA